MSDYVKQFDTTDGAKKYDFQSLGNFPVCEAGQTLKVAAVDENGQPTAWAAGDVNAASGGVGMGIDLLEEVEKMEYCKVLDCEREAPEISKYFADAIIQTAWRSKDGNRTVLAYINATDPGKLVINVNGRATSVDTMNVYETTIASSNAMGTITAANANDFTNFNGVFHIVPVEHWTEDGVAEMENKVMVRLAGTFSSRHVENSTNYVGGYSIGQVVIVNTDNCAVETSLRCTSYSTSSKSGTHYVISDHQNFGIGNHDYCYWNETYGYYYLVFAGPHSAYTTYGSPLIYLAPGEKVLVGDSWSSYEKRYGVVISGQMGVGYYSSNNSTATFRWAYPVSDTEIVYCEIEPNTSANNASAFCLYLQTYLHTLTSYKSSDSESLGAVKLESWGRYGSPFAFSYQGGGNPYCLMTKDRKLYVFLGGATPTGFEGEETDKLNRLVRFGPFGADTSTENPPEMVVLDQIVSDRTGDSHAPLQDGGMWDFIGCYDRDPDRLLYGVGNDYYKRYVYGYVGDESNPIRTVLPGVMTPFTAGSVFPYYENGYHSNPWASGKTLPTCWYSGDLTQAFYCDADRNVYFGPLPGAIDTDDEGCFWECPKTGTYKFILVGGGAAGGEKTGGGAGHLRICTADVAEGEMVYYRIGRGGYSTHTQFVGVQDGDGTTWVRYDDGSNGGTEAAACGRGARGGANGNVTGGGGGYDLTEYGGNAPYSSDAPSVRNSASRGVSATGYGAGGDVNGDGRNGVIVIVR